MALQMMYVCQAEDGIRSAQESRGLGDVYRKQEGDLVIDLVAVAVAFVDPGPFQVRLCLLMLLRDQVVVLTHSHKRQWLGLFRPIALKHYQHCMWHLSSFYR